MSEVVSKWILNRLGLIIDMSPDSFALKTMNGRLLAQLLQSYEIITQEEISLIRDTDNVNECYENFKLISIWLNYLNLTLNHDDIYEIVHGIGLTSLHLFFQVFLELKNKTKLDFLTDNELNTQLNRINTRFFVTKVTDSEDPNKFDLHTDGLCEPFLAGGDVYHWYKDRVENLQTRCKEARDEYMHNVKNSGKSLPEHGLQQIESGFVFQRGIALSPRPSILDTRSFVLPTEELDSMDGRTYDELVKLQEDAKKITPITPNPKEAKKIIKKLHTKSKVKAETKILRNQLHQEIMNVFDSKINETKAKTADDVITNIFLKQSMYEKELITKVGQVKMFKEYMVENKLKQCEILNQLKEKDFMDALIQKDKELNEKKLTYYLESERLLRLHRRIWEERQRLKAQRHQAMCLKAVEDMVDVSIRISEHKGIYGQEPNRREMQDLKNLFVTSQPVFDICDPVVNIIKDTIDEIPEEIITRETMRQDAVDSEEFDRYMRYQWPWELKNIETSQELIEQIGCGLNVLGSIVHKALNAKFPIIPLWDKPQLPETSVRVCVNGLNDTSILGTLKTLLSERNIKVIELPEAINFCIQAYYQESKREYEEEDSVKESKPTKTKAPPKPKKGTKSKKSKIKQTDSHESFQEPLKQLENKLVQTPIKFPCEEICYSRQAMLGKTAQELLDEGDPLGDFLIIDMFIEYLKNLPNAKGWVLVNYPTTYEQATILEEAVTGVKLLDPANIHTPEGLSEINDQEEKDVCSLYTEGKRNSRLLPNPIVPETIKFYDTILTAYIRIRKLPRDDKSGDAVLPPEYEELGEESDPLDRFYSNAGANYSMYYKEFDATTIKYLGKLIIGDYSLPLKNSLELFGEVANLDGRGPAKGVKATKKGQKLKPPKQRMVYLDPAQVEVPPKGKASKKGKSKVIIVYESKGVQVPSDDEDEPKDVVEIDAEEQEPPRPGQKGWEYSSIDCPEELLIALATIWETVEEIYINDFKQVFFLKRINLSSIMPFVNYVKEAMEKVIDCPDYKGFYLAKFQTAFNSFDMNFRRDDEFKAEMHCRINDFKEKLTEMSDLKMMEAENMRCMMIGANWTPCQITEIINTYINMFQIEIDRFIESVRFTNDYYMGIFVGMPTDSEGYKADLIPKIHEIDSNAIYNTFQDRSSTITMTHFDEIFTGILQKAHNCMKKINAFTTTLKEKMKAPLPAGSQKSKSKASSPRSKASKDAKQIIGLDTSDITKDTYDKLMDEWHCAVNGETLRATLRLDLLKFNVLKTINDFLVTIQQAFHEVFDQIRNKYRIELENIEIACNVFRLAVENEEAVQKELLFDQSVFRINPDVNLFEKPPIIPPLLPEEVVEEGAFAISNLSKLVDIFLDLSPKGYIPLATFTFILQDVVWLPQNDEWMSPELWRNLDYKGLRGLIDSLCDDLEYVYWRDFIVQNLRVEPPSEKELLVTRAALRNNDPDGTELVQDYQFFATKLWFEYAFLQENKPKVMAIKRLLYKMYYIPGYGLNYTVMLLDFCKSTVPLEGFAKALELSVGKLVCWNPEMGRDFVEDFRKNNEQHDDEVKRRDEEKAECYEAAYKEVVKLVDEVVHQCEDVIIEEIKSDDDEDHKNEEPKDDVVVKLCKDLPDNVATDSNEFTEVVFFLPEEVLVAVVTAALPWHSRVQNIEDASFLEKILKLHESLKTVEFNGEVLCHEFLNCEEFLDLLASTKKFNHIDPVRVLYDRVIKDDSNK